MLRNSAMPGSLTLRPKVYWRSRYARKNLRSLSSWAPGPVVFLTPPLILTRACASSDGWPRTSTLTWTRQHVWRVHALRVHGMCMTCVWRVHGMRTACAQLAHSARPTRTYRPTVAASPTHRYLWLQPLYSNPPLPTVAASPTHRYLRLQPLHPTATYGCSLYNPPLPTVAASPTHCYLRLQPLLPTVTYGCRPFSTRSRSTTTSRRQASSRPSAGPRTLAPATA